LYAGGQFDIEKVFDCQRRHKTDGRRFDSDLVVRAKWREVIGASLVHGRASRLKIRTSGLPALLRSNRAYTDAAGKLEADSLISP
jgi:hypothetical protein